MGYEWGDGTAQFWAHVGNVNPYEDWEGATRPAVAAAQGGAAPDLWQPVYVELLPGCDDSAKALLEALRNNIPGNEIVAGKDATAYLYWIAGQKGLKPAPRLFVFRPESLAYETDLGGGVTPYAVIQVGPAVPEQFVAPRSTFDDAYPAAGPREIGATVMTAVIDDFIGIANERFCRPDGTTRVLHFWAQGMPSMTGAGAMAQPVIGQEWDKADIDARLAAAKSEPDFYAGLFPDGVPFIPAPYRRGDPPATLYDPDFRRPFAFAASHGTHVADLAAGFRREEGPADRPIVAVQLPQLATYETWGARLELFILLGLFRIFHWADNWRVTPAGRISAPLVVNLSYGIHAGPKDGTGFLEAEIARLVALRNDVQKVPTAVVLPSGNAYRSQTHARMDLAPAGTAGMVLRVQPEDLSVSFLELWLDGLETAELMIAPPVGDRHTFPLSKAPAIWDWQRTPAGGGAAVTVGRLYVQPRPGGRVRVVFALCPTLNHGDPDHTAAPGAYGLDLTNKGNAPLTAQWDVQRDDTPTSFPSYGRQAYLDHEAVSGIDAETGGYIAPLSGPVARENTLSAYATALNGNVVVVGGAFDRDGFPDKVDRKATLYAGSGQAVNGAKPHLSAVSEETRSHPGMLATGTFSGSAALFAGTSTAAPQVTRKIVEAWSAPNAPAPMADTLRAILPAYAPAADPRLGHGTVALPATGRPARRMRD